VTLPPFQTLLDVHGRDVHRFLAAAVGSEDAEDCYQETWLSALRAYPRLRDGANLRGWLLRIAQRKAIDHLRRRARAPLPVAEPHSVDGDQGEEARANGGDGTLWAAVRALPAKQRTALALRYVLDADYGLIASAMGTSEAAARRSVHEGLKRLRREYRR